MIIPDIAGLTLGEAEIILKESRLDIDKITVLTPPRDKSMEYDKSFRVIRIINEKDKLEVQISKPL